MTTTDLSTVPLIRKSEIRSFIDSLDLQNRFECIVAVERKGLALLRTLDIGSDQVLDLKKLCVLSDHAMTHLPPRYFNGKSILALDDSVFTGRKLRHISERLRQMGAANVDSASIISFTGAETVPTFCLHEGLPYWDYKEHRQALIDYLCESNLLVLDSEHLSIKIKTDMSIEEFCSLLTRLDRAIQIPAARQYSDRRVYITLDRPRYFQLTEDMLQPGSKTDGMVFKLRAIVCEGSAWLIPMVYPAIPIYASKDTCPLCYESSTAGICADKVLDNDSSVFHCQSLYLSARLLARTLKLLSLATDIEFYPIKMPLYSFRTVFPNANCEALQTWIDQTIDEELSAVETSDILLNTGLDLITDDAGIIEASDNIAERLLAYQDRSEQLERPKHQLKAVNHFLPDESISIPYRLLTSSDDAEDSIMKSGAVDSLIDQAIITALPIRVYDANTDQVYWERGMRLGGEYIRTLIRRALRLKATQHEH